MGDGSSIFGIVEHPNLVKLIGYCAVNGERAIQRSGIRVLAKQELRRSSFRSGVPASSWVTRLHIILGAAEGLSYLHEGLEVQGLLAMLLLYIETGHLTDKSDVWSFGVVLYEILTGRRSLERGRAKPEQILLDWVKLFPADGKKFKSIMDPRLENRFSISAARDIAKLADDCLSKSPKGRPKMSQVVERLKQIIRVSNEATNEEIESPEVSDTESEHNSYQSGGSESWKRRMAHLAKLGEHGEAASRRRLMMLQKAKVA
ncbi:Tetratricopeptide repeat-like superfamily protein [Hibiscus syriacus]|uniref:Tetratricopeptide repeat-like superfamily protein n=1 Tax=Hibiscus syriacus TaxID=106335 RepID=A0A6A3BZC6_HIBSY|nr:Tetratricopeptide repeat-like superfamily protein [Hibiscus syriacus]